MKSQNSWIVYLLQKVLNFIIQFSLSKKANAAEKDNSVRNERRSDDFWTLLSQVWKTISSIYASLNVAIFFLSLPLWGMKCENLIWYLQTEFLKVHLDNSTYYYF